MISNALATVNKPGTHRVEAALYLTSFRDRAHAECASLERFVSGAIMFALTLCSNDVMPLECRSNVGAPNCKNFGFLSYVLTSLRRHCSMCDQFLRIDWTESFFKHFIRRLSRTCLMQIRLKRFLRIPSHRNSLRRAPRGGNEHRQ